MKKSLSIITAVILFASGLQSCIKKDTPKSINVAGLLSITGNWSTLGLNSKAAMQFAAQDINNYLDSKHANFRLTVSFYDTRLDPAAARQDFFAATGNGTRFIIGPQSSSELANIIGLADSNGTIIISQGSTAGSLAIAGDGVFRFCPSDQVEGAAIANTIFKDGIQGIVTIARNDAGNLGLQQATGTAFSLKGGTASPIDPYSTTTTDFTSVISSIKAKVTQLISTYGITHTAVYLASFDETAQLFAQASSDSLLSQVKWYGGDGVALSAAVLANTNADIFAARTGFFAPSFGLPASLQDRWQPLVTRIKANTGIDPDAFALAAYDAMWVIAYTLESTHENVTDYAKLKAIFMQQANTYSGVTGPTTLDANGDRASGSFDYWGIMLSGSNYKWTLVGKSE